MGYKGAKTWVPWALAMARRGLGCLKPLITGSLSVHWAYRVLHTFSFCMCVTMGSKLGSKRSPPPTFKNWKTPHKSLIPGIPWKLQDLANTLCGMWNLPRPGIKLLPPALAGRFLITGPPGKSDSIFLCILFYLFIYGYAGSSLLHRLFSSCGKQGIRSSCRARASHRSGSSCCWAWAPGCAGTVVACRLSSCSSRALQHRLNGYGAQA